MLAIFDVDYRENGTAVLGGVVLSAFADPEPAHEFVLPFSSVADYEPGHFYKRELPCLLKGLEHIHIQLNVPDIQTVIVDGYVWLDAHHKPGLGARLFDELAGRVPVIGVAKSAFKDIDQAEQVYRSQSQRPLFITAAGMDGRVAAEKIRQMAGQSRLPDMVKRADRLCRDG